MQDVIEWQTGIWDRMSGIYRDEVDRRFAPIVRRAVDRAGVGSGDAVLDVGCGTGSVALEAAARVGGDGAVVGVDPSGAMLEIAAGRARAASASNVSFRQAPAESIPADRGFFDVAIACLSLMYVADREAAAAELARVLRRGGRFVAVVWAGPDHADIVRFQQTVGAFAPPPPAPVGPGSLADPKPLVDGLARHGVDVGIEAETFSFDLDGFESTWELLAQVTASQLPTDRHEEARAAARELFWSDGDGPRTFTNRALFLVGSRR